MAIIPVGQKFHTVSSTVDTTDRGSSELQSQREIYTMQDIADSVTSLKTEVINVSGAEWVGLEVATLAIKAAPGANKTIRVDSAEIKFDVDSGGYVIIPHNNRKDKYVSHTTKSWQGRVLLR